MKWNIIIGSLVLGLCVSSQSYGFELLDRMLGLKGCGCEEYEELKELIEKK